jgi:hypothetical protein
MSQWPFTPRPKHCGSGFCSARAGPESFSALTQDLRPGLLSVAPAGADESRCASSGHPWNGACPFARNLARMGHPAAMLKYRKQQAPRLPASLRSGRDDNIFCSTNSRGEAQRAGAHAPSGFRYERCLIPGKPSKPARPVFSARAGPESFSALTQDLRPGLLSVAPAGADESRCVSSGHPWKSACSFTQNATRMGHPAVDVWIAGARRTQGPSTALASLRSGRDDRGGLSG